MRADMRGLSAITCALCVLKPQLSRHGEAFQGSRHGEAIMADLCDRFPQPDLKPVEVVGLQLQALHEADARVYWRFVSPEGKRAIGVKRGYTHNSFPAAPAARLPQPSRVCTAHPLSTVQGRWRTGCR